MSILTKLTKVAVVCSGLALAGCSTSQGGAALAPDQVLQLAEADMGINSFTMIIPEDLEVSEGNSYWPAADIVWRDDPFGDRRAQVTAIFTEAVNRNRDDFNGANPVNIEIQLHRFHSLTERARYSVGGTHSMHFTIWVRDARTGVPLIDGRRVDASFPAFGGAAALQAESRGQTQKVRVTARLEYVIQQILKGQAF